MLRVPLPSPLLLRAPVMMERLAATTILNSLGPCSPDPQSPLLDCLSPHLRARAQAHGHQTAAATWHRIAQSRSINIVGGDVVQVEQVTFAF